MKWFCLLCFVAGLLVCSIWIALIIITVVTHRARLSQFPAIFVPLGVFMYLTRLMFRFLQEERSNSN